MSQVGLSDHTLGGGRHGSPPSPCGARVTEESERARERLPLDPTHLGWADALLLHDAGRVLPYGRQGIQAGWKNRPGRGLLQPQWPNGRRWRTTGNLPALLFLISARTWQADTFTSPQCSHIGQPTGVAPVSSCTLCRVDRAGQDIQAGAMTWSVSSPTVVGLCTDQKNVFMSRGGAGGTGTQQKAAILGYVLKVMKI